MMAQEIENERIMQINKVASQDCRSNDPKYNRGLRAVQKFGYEHVMGTPDVEYWCKCNNL